MAVNDQGISRNGCRLEQASGVPKRQVAKSRPRPRGFGREVHRALTIASLVHQCRRDIFRVTPRFTVIASICSMSFNRGPKRSRLRLWAREMAPYERLAGAFSSPNARKMRRRMRRWLNANGLTIMLVFAMMIFAWMIAGH
jgi:hypothetical protein